MTKENIIGFDGPRNSKQIIEDSRRRVKDYLDGVANANVKPVEEKTPEELRKSFFGDNRLSISDMPIDNVTESGSDR